MKESVMIIREALESDLYQIIKLYVQDKAGRKREKFSDPLPEIYAFAFKEIQNSENTKILVGELYGEIIATVQVTIIPHLNRAASKRMQLEAMQVRKDQRSKGFGTELLRYIEKEAEKHNCKILQLDTDLRRLDAKRFYERNGYIRFHAGMKKFLDDSVV